MFPWIESHVFYLGPIPIQTWGFFVACGFLIGAWLAAKRAKQKGLNPKHVWDMAFWIFLSAMIGSRIFHVLVYDPVYYFHHPWAAVDPRAPGFAIYGGLIAGAAAFWFYVKRHALNVLNYADVLIWGVPWGCGIGRIGCFLIHDHPGTLSSFVLAVKYPDGSVRHDLGLYLSLVGFLIGAVFLVVSRRKRTPGFYLWLFLILDSASRLWLDFYRVADVRFVGLTPTQWISLPVIAIGLRFLLRKRLV